VVMTFTYYSAKCGSPLFLFSFSKRGEGLGRRARGEIINFATMSKDESLWRQETSLKKTQLKH
jgi:hypothetical protein